MTVRFLSDIDHEEYKSLEAQMATDPRGVKKRLAQSVTKIVHGEAGLATAERASQMLFGGEIDKLVDRELLSIFADVPSCSMPRQSLDAGVSIIDAMVTAALATSKGDARRTIENGGAYVNNRKCESIDRVLKPEDLASESVIVLRSGKRKYALLRFE
jgi:tyrosyl-tRNA synthetase